MPGYSECIRSADRSIGGATRLFDGASIVFSALNSLINSLLTLANPAIADCNSWAVRADERRLLGFARILSASSFASRRISAAFASASTRISCICISSLDNVASESAVPP